MTDFVLFQTNHLQVVVKSEADAAAVELLKNTLYGTKGIRYQQTGQARKVKELYDPYFFHLYLDGVLQGLYCLDHRVTEGVDRIHAFYGRYLTVAEPYQQKGYGQLLKMEAVKYMTAIYPAPFLFYSYIEARNTRSLRLSEQLNFTPIATLGTFVFRRLNPVFDSRVSPLTNTAAFLPLLKAHYRAHSLVVLEKVFDQGHYFVLNDSGHIRAGVHANPVHWAFTHLPGLSGWMMMHGFPHLPLLNKLFEPNYAFLALEGIYVEPGYEHLLSVLIESVLAHFGLYAALIQLDRRDALGKVLQDKKGIFGGFQSGVSTKVLVKAVGVSEEELERLRQTPVYVSSFDFT